MQVHRKIYNVSKYVCGKIESLVVILDPLIQLAVPDPSQVVNCGK